MLRTEHKGIEIEVFKFYSAVTEYRYKVTFETKYFNTVVLCKYTYKTEQEALAAAKNHIDKTEENKA